MRRLSAKSGPMVALWLGVTPAAAAEDLGPMKCARLLDQATRAFADEQYELMRLQAQERVER